jgi:hypothetical protein
MILSLHVVNRSLVHLLLLMLRAQRHRSQVLQNIPIATLDLHSGRLHSINLVRWQENLMFCNMCIVINFPRPQHRGSGGFTPLRRDLVRYLIFGQFFRSISQLLPVLKNLHGFLDLSAKM